MSVLTRVVYLSLFFIGFLSLGARCSSPQENSDFEIFGMFQGLDLPFSHSAYPYFSPVLGFDQNPLRGRRMFGDYGPEKVEDFKRPVCTSEETSPLWPQNVVASVLERLFPSGMGLVANTSRGDKINNYLKPANIARIFIAISEPNFFDFESQPMNVAGTQINRAIMLLTEAFLPETISKNLSTAHKRGISYEPSIEHAKALDSTFEVASLLLRAFKCSLSETCRILVTYMREKITKKDDLKPFYLELSKAGRIDGKLVSQIDWTSYYSADDYFGKAGLTPLERDLLQKLGYPYFEGPLPPVVHWGMTSVYVDGVKYLCSDCGNSILLNMFMQFLCKTKNDEKNRKVKFFDVSKLLELRSKGYQVSEKLINFFTNICPTPAHVVSKRARFEWSEVLNSLNRPGDLYKVKYLLPAKGEPFYAIDVGVINLLRVLGNLFGRPAEFDMEMKDRFSCNRNWNWIGHIFSDVKADDCWTIRATPHELETDAEIHDIIEIQPARDLTNLTLVFRRGNCFSPIDIFELHFEDRHFDYSLCSYAPTNYDRKQLMSLKDIQESVFSGDLDSVNGKLEALDKILGYRKFRDPEAFKHTLRRWLEPTGRYFLGWNYGKVNTLAAKVLMKYLTMAEILDLQIPKLYSVLMRPLAEQGRFVDIAVVLAIDLLRYQALGCPPHQNSYLKMARVLSEVLEKAEDEHLKVLLRAGANNYVQKVAGVNLLHLASYAGNGSVDYLIDNGFNVNERTAVGMTPLHFAAMANRGYFITTTKILLARGAQIHSTLPDGRTVLYLAAESLDAAKNSENACWDSSEVRKASGRRDYCILSEDIDAGIDMQFYAERFKLTVQAGADCSGVFENGKTYLEWIKPMNNGYLLNVVQPKEEKTPSVPKKTTLIDDGADFSDSDEK